MQAGSHQDDSVTRATHQPLESLAIAFESCSEPTPLARRQEILFPGENCARKPGLFLLSVCLAALLDSSSQAATTPRDAGNGKQMYSGASMSCLIANDFYAVHFTALQHGQQTGETSEFVKYCQEIPTTGKTYLTIDLLDRDARNLPIALRIVEEELGIDGQPPKEKSTLAEVPARIYKNGVADTHADITQPGHYALIASFGEEGEITEDDRLRIPFSVALASPNKASPWLGRVAMFLVSAFFLALGIAGYRTLRPRKNALNPGMASYPSDSPLNDFSVSRKTSP
jgi:hypothetical protein